MQLLRPPARRRRPTPPPHPCSRPAGTNNRASPSQSRMALSQDPPHLGNQFSDDPFLQSLLGRLLPPAALPEVQADLGEAAPSSRAAERSQAGFRSTGAALINKINSADFCLRMPLSSSALPMLSPFVWQVPLMPHHLQSALAGRQPPLSRSWGSRRRRSRRAWCSTMPGEGASMRVRGQVGRSRQGRNGASAAGPRVATCCRACATLARPKTCHPPRPVSP